MKNLILIICGLIFSIHGYSQQVTGATELAFKKGPVPYDIKLIAPLADGHFVILKKEKKNAWSLKRFDSYMFEVWNIGIIKDKRDAIPQLRVKGDTIYLITWSVVDEEILELSIDQYNAGDGQLIAQNKYSAGANVNTETPLGLVTNDELSVFGMYYVAAEQMNFQFVRTGDDTFYSERSLPEDAWKGAVVNCHLDNDGTVFCAFADPVAYKLKVYYAAENDTDWSMRESNFSFSRPMEKSGDIHIVRTNATTFNVMFGAYIEDELIGINESAYNVVLNTEIFCRSLDLKQDVVGNIYANAILTNIKQRKKWLKTPEILDDFRLTNVSMAEDGHLIAFVEKLDGTIDYHHPLVTRHLDTNAKTDEDDIYVGDDLIILSFSPEGQLAWSRVIQKVQISQGGVHPCSYVPFVDGDLLRMIIWDSEKSGTLYLTSLNMSSGDIAEPTRLLNSKTGLNKSYTTWVDGRKLLLGLHKPGSPKKVSISAVELPK